MRITVTINGQSHTLPKHATVAGLVRCYGGGRGVAVAVNETFVPRESHDDYTVKAGDQIELLSPMEGG